MSSARPQARFGTFGGVWTPSVLTILGVIMFMRAGYVVGHSGIWYALLILLFSKLISGTTALSVSAIATNTEIGTGGNYFIISRSLGPVVGGTIGLMLFVSLAVAVSFYVIGFTEALLSLFAPPGSELAGSLESARVPQLISCAMIGALFFLSFKGADVAMRAQYIILVVLLASVVSFLIGGLGGFDAGQFADNSGPMEGSIGFWAAFAIFFPAVTGIESGANMSGDLKDPARSIPNGTLAAIAFTAVIYALLLLLLAGYTDAETLARDPFGTLTKMSVFGPLIVAGVFAATLSSALASFLGSPRILQAMGKDRILPQLEYFGAGHGPTQEPRRATVLALVIALAVVWMGGLNVIAEIISMFFLISYGMINLSAFVEGRSGNPSFRPRFRFFGWPIAVAGAALCGIAMFKINETYAVISMILASLLFVWLRGRVSGDWRNATRGFVFSRTRINLLQLEKLPEDPKNWRPILAVVTDDAERDLRMIEHAAWLESERGLLSVIEVIEPPPGSTPETVESIRRERMEKLRALLGEHDINAFVTCFTSAGKRIDGLVQAYSIGPLRPNTYMVTVPPPGHGERRAWLADAIRTIAPLSTSVVAYKGARAVSDGQPRIDIWWHGQQNGSLMALLAYLVQSQPRWKSAEVRILRVVNTAEDHLLAEEELNAMVGAARVDMSIEIVLTQRPVLEVIAERSGGSSLVFLGLSPADLAEMERLLAARDELLAALPTTLLVRSNGDCDLVA
jgi:amino acid transporter